MDVGVLPHERGGERVDLDQVADLGVVPAGEERVVLGHEARVVGQRAVHVARRQHDELLHAVAAAVVEELARAAHVHVEALCLGAAEVAHGAEMHDRIRLLLAQRVLEGARADVGPVERRRPRGGAPSRRCRPRRRAGRETVGARAGGPARARPRRSGLFPRYVSTGAGGRVCYKKTRDGHEREVRDHPDPRGSGGHRLGSRRDAGVVAERPADRPRHRARRDRRQGRSESRGHAAGAIGQGSPDPALRVPVRRGEEEAARPARDARPRLPRRRCRPCSPIPRTRRRGSWSAGSGWARAPRRARCRRG